MIEHCCAEMTRQLELRCPAHTDAFACPDAVVGFDARFQEYGLIVHDGGMSSVGIVFCPWCGTRLPESRRDGWFDALEARGVDPWEDEIPAEFQDGGWLRHEPGDTVGPR
ncbi:DUF6980 family protein [Streptomyces sp. A012304]|uniref:DUF6980 family protein n=1 Tax=Streptomyces sp. A012304 TaxID=375446 RepID=UPI0022329488|nr:hypothetical protein [Streptomyces sp. A012304]GKQ35915.1 hypothetical protein ALMP_24580 [Streptomyces sp. A012304]